jgi:mono/diheme cytochrome c family protein
MSFTMNLRAVGATMVTLAVLGAAMAYAAPPAPAKGVPAKGNAVAGKAIFNVKCIACHKVDGTGGIKLTGNPTPNWKDPKVWADPKRKNVDAYMRDCITNGKLPSGMVAWGKTGQIKPADIENLIAYIHVLSGRK